jgi:hypothetical protein
MVTNTDQQFTPAQMNFISQMGVKPDDNVSAKHLYWGLKGDWSERTAFRKFAAIREQEELPSKCWIPVATFLKYVVFVGNTFSGIKLPEETQKSRATA